MSSCSWWQITSDGTLEIENAQLDDSAHYRCSATNYLGRASSAARVRVSLPQQQGRMSSCHLGYIILDMA